MNTILYCSVDKLWSNEFFNQKISLLPEILQQKILVYKDKKDQQLKICGKLMLQQLMYDFNAVQGLNDLKYDVFNKPFINKTFQFSIAHSEDIVVCVAALEKNIGIDIEKIKPIDVLLLKDNFTAKERLTLKLNNFDINYFYFLWTRKEAVLKAIGKGIFEEMGAIDVLKNEIIYDAQSYNIFDVLINNEYKVALACNKKDVFEVKEFVVEY